MNLTPTLHTLPHPLFHGSAVRFNRIDVSKGRGHKDFGKGFYLAFSADQAIGMMHKKYHEAVSRRRDHRPGDYQEVLYRAELTHDAAYRQVLGSEFFKLVGDPDTRLFLEPNKELVRLYDLERQSGIDALYTAIS